jgi:hypothetical protein
VSESSRIVQFFKRDRRPADLIFAAVFLLLALFLVSQLGEETKWVKRTKLFAQPAFWPAVALIGMAFFAVLHFIGSICSPRIPGRREELLLWLRSIEFAFWFLAYVWVVPIIGYLLATILFMLGLTLRLGYREARMYVAAAGTGLFIVVVFKFFLQVKIPGGQIYEYLPDALRNFMILNF